MTWFMLIRILQHMFQCIGNHWFWWQFVAFSVPNHYIIQTNVDLLSVGHLQRKLNHYWRKCLKDVVSKMLSIFVEACWIKHCVLQNQYAKHGMHVQKRFCPLEYDDVMKWKHFPHCWPFVRGIHRSPVNSPHKGQWCGALMFSMICVWINVWVNNHEAGNLEAIAPHYDVNIMNVGCPFSIFLPSWTGNYITI